MAITLSDAARNASANGVVDLLDTGSADAAGDVVIMTAADAILATVALQNPAFGNAASGVATCLGVPLSTTASATGVAAKFRARDRDNNQVIEGTVTATGGGGDMTVDNVNLANGQAFNITSFTYTQPAS